MTEQLLRMRTELPDEPKAEDFKAHYPESFWKRGEVRAGQFKSYQELAAHGIRTNELLLRFLPLDHGAIAHLICNWEASSGGDSHVLLVNDKLRDIEDYRAETCYFIDGSDGYGMSSLRTMHEAGMDLVSMVLEFSGSLRR